MLSGIIGHNQQAKTFLNRFESNRFPHAWLFSGPRGVGKSSLAELLAAVVMGDSYSLGSEGFQLNAGLALSKIHAGNHPDVRQIHRNGGDGEASTKMISVDEIRAVTSFFELQASQGGYRICIVDAMDELNPNGTNALLKTLEEPPRNSLLILIYHGSMPLLPTIRSRCVELSFNPLTDGELSQLSEDVVSPDLVTLAAGSVGRLRAYQDIDCDGLISTIKANALSSWPELSGQRLTGVAREMSVSELHFEVGTTLVLNWLAEQAKEGADGTRMGLMSSAWEEISRSIARGHNLRLDLAERSAAFVNQIMQIAHKDRQT